MSPPCSNRIFWPTVLGRANRTTVELRVENSSSRAPSTYAATLVVVMVVRVKSVWPAVAYWISRNVNEAPVAIAVTRP